LCSGPGLYRGLFIFFTDSRKIEPFDVVIFTKITTMMIHGIISFPISEGDTYYQINGVVRLRKIDGKVFMQAKGGTWISPVDVEGRPIEEHSRYVCRCDLDKIADDEYRYSQQVLLELPEFSRDRQRRQKKGLTTAICVDPCIAGNIQKLWRNSIETLGCCCGHGKERAWVSVHPDNYVQMFELGYEQRPVEVIMKREKRQVMGLYTFYL